MKRGSKSFTRHKPLLAWATAAALESLFRASFLSLSRFLFSPCLSSKREMPSPSLTLAAADGIVSASGHQRQTPVCLTEAEPAKSDGEKQLHSAVHRVRNAADCVPGLDLRPSSPHLVQPLPPPILAIRRSRSRSRRRRKRHGTDAAAAYQASRRRLEDSSQPTSSRLHAISGTTCPHPGRNACHHH